MTDKRKKVACLYHSDSDGFGASWAVHRALKDTCEMLFISVQYGQEPPYEELRTFGPEKIFIVDFSYKAPVLKELSQIYPEITVMDHHKTALADLREWVPEGETMVNGVVNKGGCSYFFDENLSGCGLTWDMFHPGEDVPEILLYVQDRDLWRFELENSKEINAYIATMPEDFVEWDNFYLPDAYTAGKAVVAFQDAQIKRRLRDVVMVEFRDLRYGPEETDFQEVRFRFLPPSQAKEEGHFTLVPFVNASENQSELGEAMCLAYLDSPFSVSYCDRPDGKRSYSLRSRNGFDVSTVCKAFGGGGHPGAGGFTLTAPDII